MYISPYLFAIQSLNGESPGDKYKELHSIAAQIIKNDEEKAEFLSTGSTRRVKPAMLPHLRILIGNKLKLNDAVIDSLKSDDVTVIKQALSAKWFFNSSNALINVEYFMTNVVPYIAVRTRLELIKILGHCLFNEPKKAEDFFDSFFNAYGLEQAAPLIVACSENYIYNRVLKYKIVLPSRILSLLYRRYPQLVIRYLQLGNKKNEQNKDDRKIHQIELLNYINFLPVLVKNHTQEFVELYQQVNSGTIEKLGSTRAEYFLKSATSVLIEKPKIFLKILPLKLVSNKLSMQQFGTMIKNFFAGAWSTLSVMLPYFKYYPQDKKLNLLKETYKLLGTHDSFEEACFQSAEVFQMLPSDEKERYARNSLKSCEGTLQYNYRIYRLPPNESIPILKEKITKPSNESRSKLIGQMISSCHLYDSKEDLLNVLLYYNTRHKNEQIEVVSYVLDKLVSKFNVKTLSGQHWKEIKKILQRVHVKGQLSSVTNFGYNRLLEGALEFYLKKCKTDPANNEEKNVLENLIGINTEYYFGQSKKWDFLTNCVNIKWDYIQMLLSEISQKYPESHKVWNTNNKLMMSSYLIKLFHDLNVSNLNTESKKKYANEIKQTILNIKNETWLIKFIKELLRTPETNKSNNLRTFKRMLREYDQKLYQDLIDQDPNLINDVKSTDAIILLKHHHTKVLEKWELYLNCCRENLLAGSKFAKNFIAATKWHHDIPIKFVDQCLQEIEEIGNMLVLGILLEGKVLGKIFEPYLPKESRVDLYNENAKKVYDIVSSLPKVMNSANPPVAFEVVASLCQGDYVSIAACVIRNLGQRMPVNKVLQFAKSLVNAPISVKKLGINLVLQVATKSESQEFLRFIWSIEKNFSIRQILAKMIMDLFKAMPSNDTWELIKICLDDVKCDEEAVINVLKDIKSIDLNFVALYLETLLKKLDEFPECEFRVDSKRLLTIDIVKDITPKILDVLPEDLVNFIVKKYFFYYNIDFTIKVYLCSDKSKFEQRLNTLMEILEDEIKLFGKPDESREYQVYPDNYRICKFFHSLHIPRDGEYHEMHLELIDRILKLFSTSLKPAQEPGSFIFLTISKSLLEAKSVRAFGTKCAADVEQLVKIFESDIIVPEVAKIIKDVTYYARICGLINESDNEVTVVHGLADAGTYFGDLTAIQLMTELPEEEYKHFTNLVNLWQKSHNVTIQAVLSMHLNSISPKLRTSLSAYVFD